VREDPVELGPDGRRGEVVEWERPYARWFLGGRLNAAYNCVDRWVERGRGEQVAFHLVPDDGPESDACADLTYAQLQPEVVRFANGLEVLGVGRGTPVPPQRQQR
jgi:acetyl-CoA synthetase